MRDNGFCNGFCSFPIGVRNGFCTVSVRFLYGFCNGFCGFPIGVSKRFLAWAGRDVSEASATGAGDGASPATGTGRRRPWSAAAAAAAAVAAAATATAAAAACPFCAYCPQVSTTLPESHSSRMWLNPRWLTTGRPTGVGEKKADFMLRRCSLHFPLPPAIQSCCVPFRWA